MAIPKEVRPLTPLGQHGAVRWLRDRLRHGDDWIRTLYDAACDAPVGAAEWRIVDDALFLNSIAVSPAYRGRGYGAALLADGLDLPADRDHVRLDVFAEEERSKAWYRDLGFSPCGSRTWWRMPLNAGPTSDRDASSWSWVDMADADRQHARYGFSRVSLCTPTSTYRIGRLGPSLFRLTSPDALTDPTVWTALRSLDSTRDVLYLPPATTTRDNPPGPAARTCAKSIRLSISRNCLRLALSRSTDDI
jgi:GNAT superfamily N-acetyltransferase